MTIVFEIGISQQRYKKAIFLTVVSDRAGVNVLAVYSLSPLPTELREQGLTRWDSRPVGLQVYTQIYASLTFAIP